MEASKKITVFDLSQALTKYGNAVREDVEAKRKAEREESIYTAQRGRRDAAQSWQYETYIKANEAKEAYHEALQAYYRQTPETENSLTVDKPSPLPSSVFKESYLDTKTYHEERITKANAAYNAACIAFDEDPSSLNLQKKRKTYSEKVSAQSDYETYKAIG